MSESKKWMVVVGICLLAVLLRYPSLEVPFDNDSGGRAYLARRIVRGEPLYGAHHPGHHLPAVYYAYALAFCMFGDSLWAVKCFLILWTVVVVCLLYRLGAQVDHLTGILAALFYLVLSSQVKLLGTAAALELFANLPRTAAILVMIRLSARREPAWKFVFVGLFAALAFLFKAVYLSPLAVAGFVLLDELWQGGFRGDVWRTTAAKGLWVACGLLIGLLLVVVYFGVLGLLPRLLLAFTLGQSYVDNLTADAGFGFIFLGPFVGLARANVVLVVLSLSGLFTVAARRFWWRRRVEPIVCYVAVWYLVTFVEAGISRVYFTHYYLLNLPPLALLAAWFLAGVLGNVVPRIGRRAGGVLAVLLLVLIVSISVGQDFDYYYSYARYQLGMTDYYGFLVDGVAGANRLLRVQGLADYVKAHTSPDDAIYYWSGDVQIYYLADRYCAIDIIWPIDAEATGPYQRIFSPQSTYVILGDSYFIPRPGWLYTELERTGYTLEAVIQDQEVYRHRE